MQLDLREVSASNDAQLHRYGLAKRQRSPSLPKKLPRFGPSPLRHDGDVSFELVIFRTADANPWVSRYLLPGSTAACMAGHAPCPVLIVREYELEFA
jgi:hypothetical protein